MFWTFTPYVSILTVTLSGSFVFTAHPDSARLSSGFHQKPGHPLGQRLLDPLNTSEPLGMMPITLNPFRFRILATVISFNYTTKMFPCGLSSFTRRFYQSSVYLEKWISEQVSHMYRLEKYWHPLTLRLNKNDSIFILILILQRKAIHLSLGI